MMRRSFRTAMALIVVVTVVAAPVLQTAEQVFRAQLHDEAPCCCAGCSVGSVSFGETGEWNEPPCPCHMQDRPIPPSQPLQAEIQRYCQADPPTADRQSESPVYNRESISDAPFVLIASVLVDNFHPLYLTCCSFLI